MEEVKLKFSDLITTSELPVLVDFYADWCGPCHAMAPAIEQIADELSDKVKVIKINIEKNNIVSELYKIASIPTLILFHKGEIKWRGSGVISVNALKDILLKFPIIT